MKHGKSGGFVNESGVDFRRLASPGAPSDGVAGMATVPVPSLSEQAAREAADKTPQDQSEKSND